MDGEQLLMIIAKNKETNKEEAKKAFELFCGYYEKEATKIAVALCRSWKRSDDNAFDIVQCAFEKVWLYPTFDKSKTHFKNTDKAIMRWLNTILIREMTLFSQMGNCSHPEPEDLPLITDSGMFVEYYMEDEYMSEEQFEVAKKKLDEIFAGLSEQEITILLTYKLYLKAKGRVPHRVLKKLRTRYGITQDAIKHCRLRVEQKLKEVQI